MFHKKRGLLIEEADNSKQIEIPFYAEKEDMTTVNA